MLIHQQMPLNRLFYGGEVDMSFRMADSVFCVVRLVACCIYIGVRTGGQSMSAELTAPQVHLCCSVKASAALSSPFLDELWLEFRHQ